MDLFFVECARALYFGGRCIFWLACELKNKSGAARATGIGQCSGKEKL
jgi:hypothetical protein